MLRRGSGPIAHCALAPVVAAASYEDTFHFLNYEIHNHTSFNFNFPPLNLPFRPAANTLVDMYMSSIMAKIISQKFQSFWSISWLQLVGQLNFKWLNVQVFFFRKDRCTDLRRLGIIAALRFRAMH